MNYFRLTYLITAIFFVMSCKKKNDFEQSRSVQWSPSLALPLINSEISAEKFLKRAEEESEVLEIDESDFITLVYQSRLYTLEGNEIFDLFPVNSILSDSINYLSFPFSNGADIRSLLLKNGSFGYTFNSTDTSDLQLTFFLPFASKNGQAFKKVINLTGSPNGHYHSGSFDLSEYEIDLTNAGSTKNKVEVDYQVLVDGQGSNLAAQYPVSVFLNNMDFEWMKGYLGKFSFDQLNDTININIFRNWVDGTLYLDDPKLSFRLQNSYGMPITADLTTVHAYNPGDGGVFIPLSSTTAVNDTFVVNYPSQIGESVLSQYLLNKDNSNLKNAIAISPKEFRYNLNMVANASADASQLSFVTDDSQLSLEMDLELPMYGRIDDAVIRDTFDFSIEGERIMDNIRTAVFKLNATNNFPLDLRMQMYFVDEDNQPLDSLLKGEEKILSSGIIDNQGKVETGSEKITLIEYDQYRSQHIRNATKIILKARVSTTDQASSSIRLYSSYYLGVKLGVISKTKLF